MICLSHTCHESSVICPREIAQRICDVISETYAPNEISHIGHIDIMIVLRAVEDMVIYRVIVSDMRIHNTLYSVECKLYGPAVSHNSKHWVCYRCTLKEK